MTEARLSESGYKRKHQKVCDICNSPELDYSIKGWIKCLKCGKLYSRKHRFEEMTE